MHPPDIARNGGARALAFFVLMCRSAMLRITQLSHDPDGPTTLLVEGRLAGPWVDELRIFARGQHTGLALDLAGLSYADAAGVALLNQLIAEGAQVVGTTAYSATLLGRT